MTDILIVDDERDIRELISEILIDEGYQTSGIVGAAAIIELPIYSVK